MASRKRMRPTSACADREPQVDLAGRQIDPATTPQKIPLQVFRADLVGFDQCTAEGLTAHAAAPVLALCRLLVEAGHDPDWPLHAYRGDVLCIIVGSIAEGARVTVEDDRHGRPRLRRWRDRDGGCGAGPPVRQNRSPVPLAADARRAPVSASPDRTSTPATRRVELLP
jgi:hypothetical protein